MKIEQGPPVRSSRPLDDWKDWGKGVGATETLIDDTKCRSLVYEFLLLEQLDLWAGAQGSSKALMSEAALGTEEKLTLGLQSIEPHCTAVVAGLNNPMIHSL